jgi:hypothetical protein
MTKNAMLTRAILSGAIVAAIILGIPVPMGLTSHALAQDGATEMAMFNQQASQLDPDEYRFVQPVCTACHTPERFLRARPWKQWEDTFRRMQAHGAQGTPDQWDHIHRYFARNLTLVDVNNDLEDEISMALAVPEDTAISVVRGAPYKDMEDLERVPGVNKAAVERIQSRLIFAPVRPPF